MCVFLRQILKPLSFNNGRKGALWNNKGKTFTYGDKSLGRCGLVPMAKSKTRAPLFCLGNHTDSGVPGESGSQVEGRGTRETQHTHLVIR